MNFNIYNTNIILINIGLAKLDINYNNKMHVHDM